MSVQLQLLQQGSSLVSNDHPDAETLDIPPDLDLEKFDRGRQFFKRNVTQCLVCMLMSLVCGLSVPNLLDALVATEVTKKPRDSIKRYIQTATHVLQWHYGDVWNRDSDARKSIQMIRRIHNRVRKFMTKRACPNCGGKTNFDFHKVSNEENNESNAFRCVCGGNGDGRDPVEGQGRNGDESDPVDGQGEMDSLIQSDEARAMRVHVSQYDMSLVQCGFMGGIILHPGVVGIRCTDTELEDYVYYWRWIGHLLGISDSNNICFEGLEQAYQKCKAIEDEIVFPRMIDRPEHFYEMAKSVTDGMNIISHSYTFSPECYFIIAFRQTGRKYPERIKIADRLRVWWFNMIVTFHLYIPGFSWAINKMTEAWFGCNTMS